MRRIINGFLLLLLTAGIAWAVAPKYKIESGSDMTTPPPIGATTPNTGKFSTLTAAGTANFTGNVQTSTASTATFAGPVVVTGSAAFIGITASTLTGNVIGDVTGNTSGSAGTVTSLSGQTTSGLTEGSNLYYTDARVRANRLDQMGIPAASMNFNGQTVTAVSGLTMTGPVNANGQGLTAGDGYFGAVHGTAVTANFLGTQQFTVSASGQSANFQGSTHTTINTGGLTVSGNEYHGGAANFTSSKHDSTYSTALNARIVYTENGVAPAGGLYGFISSGQSSVVPAGAAGLVLTATGAASLPTWQAAAGGGAPVSSTWLFNVVKLMNSSTYTVLTKSPTPEDITITTSSASSKVLLLGAITVRIGTAGAACGIRYKRGGSVIATNDVAVSATDASPTPGTTPIFAYLDSPGAAGTYIYTVEVNRSYGSGDCRWVDQNAGYTGLNQLILLEII